MKLLKEIIAYGALVAGSLGLFGCSDVRKPVAKPVASVSTGYGQPYVAVGDVTGDGLEDIVIGNKSGISVLENQGAGIFKPLK